MHHDRVAADSAGETSTGKRRGRRSGGQDTRTALLDAARAVFSESGYDGATVRTIATRAGVDAAMVNHWFGSKEGLFAKAVLQLPFDPGDLLLTIMEGDLAGLGERIARAFLTRWDGSGREVFQALVRSVATHEQVAHALRDLFLKQVFGTLATRIKMDRPELRAALCASQLIGMGMIRYVARFEPVASADIETLIPAVAPNIQRYLTGDLG